MTPSPDISSSPPAVLPTTQPHRPELDVSRVVETDADPRPIDHHTGHRRKGFSVVIRRSTLDAIHAHGRADTSVEICGVLVGRLCRDYDGPYLLIQAHIAGDKAASQQTQVTFTAETWNEIQRRMETDFAGLKVVGWYHTHPGFGVFLSGMDLFIQDNFFNLPWQVAWVYDPIAETDGVFVWNEGQSVASTFLVEEDTDPGRPQELPHFPVPISPVQEVAITVALFAAGFVIVWFLLQWLTQHGFRVRLPIEW